MYSSVILVAILSYSVSPALAAPLRLPLLDNQPGIIQNIPVESVFVRDASNMNFAHADLHHSNAVRQDDLGLFARQASQATTAPTSNDSSGAISVKGVLSDVASVAGAVLPFFLKREDDLVNIFNRRELELIARLVPGSILANPVKETPAEAEQSLNSIRPYLNLDKRADMPLVHARQASPFASTAPPSISSSDASGAISVKNVVSDVASVAGAVLPFFFKREDLLMMARSLDELD